MANQFHTLRRLGALVSVIVLLLTAALGFGGCQKTEPKRYEATFLELFDTMTTIVGYSDTKESFSHYSQLIYDELKVYHQFYDIYHNYDGINNLKTINDNAGKAPVKVDQKIIDMLLLAKEMFTITNGQLNVAMGSVLRIWHDYRTEGLDDPESARLPTDEELQEASRHTDISGMVIDTAASTVYLTDPAMSLDVGALGKGYATEQVCRLAEEQGMASALVSVGGNVRSIGTKPGKKPWNVGVQNPDTSSEKSSLCHVNLIELSLVTSGNYERFYTVNGKNYHHIIDPDTLYPADYFASVTIVCPDSGLADCLSTSVYCMPYEEGLSVIESIDGAGAMWVYADGSIQYSSRFSQYLRD